MRPQIYSYVAVSRTGLTVRPCRRTSAAFVIMVVVGLLRRSLPMWIVAPQTHVAPRIFTCEN
jgi:hypothetical protein